jgi:hypothetical protein
MFVIIEILNFQSFVLENPRGFLFFNALLRCRSGCKGAIIFNSCQVLFSLFLNLFFRFVFQLTTAIPFVVAGCKGANIFSAWQVKNSLF